ncbi:MAG: [Clostridia bacterium]|nr:[FeFe] hydrogenase H-cluster maturation GTPase HydF [Clostridia bacterium]
MSSMNNTPNADRIHIGIFGKRNAGKSSLINAITGQDLAIVSDFKGTTTDPVSKAMEILPLGAVNIIDTPGLDDEGELGALRVKKAYKVLNKTDIALVVVDFNIGFSEVEEKLIEKISEKKIPYIIVYNKSENFKNDKPQENEIYVSAVSGKNIDKLKEKIAATLPHTKEEIPIVSDLVNKGDRVIMVVPIDEAAPKGRIILPQQQTLRELLDVGAITTVVQIEELKEALTEDTKLVITDSQAFKEVSEIVPENIALTSFSILFARHKGNLKILTDGVKALENLNDGDKILISEGCTHHRQCGDIGSVKIPAMLKKITGKNLDLTFSSGTEFTDNISDYKLVIHCGGCMLNEREMKYRIACAKDSGIPIVNYGIFIAYAKGILKRSIEIFEDRL